MSMNCLKGNLNKILRTWKMFYSYFESIENYGKNFSKFRFD